MKQTDPEIANGCDLDVSPARAFALLTEPAELSRWFAEDVEIDPRAGGLFTYAGRGAYVPTSTKLTAFEPGRTLAWEWPLHGVLGYVTATVTPAEPGDGCRVDVVCSFPTLPPIPRGREHVDDLWRFHLGALKALSEGETDVVLPDFGDPTPEVRQSIHIAAPRSAVFKALIEPEMLAEWTLFGKPEVDPRIGGKYSYGWVYEAEGKTLYGGPTRILDMEQDVRLVTDWPDWRGDDTNGEQKITWLLEDDGTGTKLTLIHDGFGRASDISDFPFGWVGFLDGIRSAVVKAQEQSASVEGKTTS